MCTTTCLGFFFPFSFLMFFFFLSLPPMLLSSHLACLSCLLFFWSTCFPPTLLVSFSSCPAPLSFSSLWSLLHSSSTIGHILSLSLCIAASLVLSLSYTISRDILTDQRISTPQQLFSNTATGVCMCVWVWECKVWCVHTRTHTFTHIHTLMS